MHSILHNMTINSISQTTPVPPNKIPFLPLYITPLYKPQTTLISQLTTNHNMGINSNRVDHYSSSVHATQQHMVTTGEPMTSLAVHDVCLPPPKSTLRKLQHRLSEVFLSDDPLHVFKNQTCLRKLILALQFLFPIFDWAPKYSFTLLRSDVVSGLTIASLAIPQVYAFIK